MKRIAEAIAVVVTSACVTVVVLTLVYYVLVERHEYDDEIVDVNARVTVREQR